MTYKQRTAASVPNPDATEKTIFNDAVDGLLKTKDSAGVVQTLATVEALEATQPKKYIALLTQAGTDAPVATVLENTLGQVPTFVYTSPGIYSLLVQDEIFVEGKTFYQCTKNDRNIDVWIDITPASVGEFVIRTGDPTAADTYLNNTPIKIEVYP